MRKPCDLLHVLYHTLSSPETSLEAHATAGRQREATPSEDEEAEPLRNEKLTSVQKNEDEVGQILHLSEPSFPRLLGGDSSFLPERTVGKIRYMKNE